MDRNNNRIPIDLSKLFACKSVLINAKRGTTTFTNKELETALTEHTYPTCTKVSKAVKRRHQQLKSLEIHALRIFIAYEFPRRQSLQICWSNMSDEEKQPYRKISEVNSYKRIRDFMLDNMKLRNIKDKEREQKAIHFNKEKNKVKLKKINYKEKSIINELVEEKNNKEEKKNNVANKWHNINDSKLKEVVSKDTTQMKLFKVLTHCYSKENIKLSKY